MKVAASRDWVRIRSAYFGELSLDAADKLCGLHA